MQPEEEDLRSKFGDAPAQIGPFEFKVEGRSKTAGTAEGCDFWDQNGVLLLHLRVQQQRKSKINEFTMSDGIE